MNASDLLAFLASATPTTILDEADYATVQGLTIALQRWERLASKERELRIRQASMGLPQAQVVSRLNASRWMEKRP